MEMVMVTVMVTVMAIERMAAEVVAVAVEMNTVESQVTVEWMLLESLKDVIEIDIEVVIVWVMELEEDVN